MIKVTSSFALGSFDFGLSDLISELTQVKSTHFTAKTKNNFICQNIEEKNKQYHWKVLFSIFCSNAILWDVIDKNQC